VVMKSLHSLIYSFSNIIMLYTVYGFVDSKTICQHILRNKLRNQKEFLLCRAITTGGPMDGWVCGATVATTHRGWNGLEVLGAGMGG